MRNRQKLSQRTKDQLMQDINSIQVWQMMMSEAETREVYLVARIAKIDATIDLWERWGIEMPSLHMWLDGSSRAKLAEEHAQIKAAKEAAA